MTVDGEWLVAQISKYIEYLDQVPQRRPAGKAEASAEYAAGLRDMAADIREHIAHETEWQGLRQFLGKDYQDVIPAHGWEVTRGKK